MKEVMTIEVKTNIILDLENIETIERFLFNVRPQDFMTCTKVPCTKNDIKYLDKKEFKLGVLTMKSGRQIQLNIDLYATDEDYNKTVEDYWQKIVNQVYNVTVRVK